VKIIKEILKIFGKGIVYSLCFLFLYKGLNLLSQPVIPSADMARQKLAAQDYLDQLDRSSSLLDESEKQHKRMSAVISQQEENAIRMKLLLDRLELKGKK
jgi:hypothetical protein